MGASDVLFGTAVGPPFATLPLALEYCRTNLTARGEPPSLTRDSDRGEWKSEWIEVPRRA